MIGKTIGKYRVVEKLGRGGIGAVVALLAGLAVQGGSATDTVQPLDVRLGRDTRLLVVAPHPDDEALGAAGLIQRVESAGGSVRVVLLTSGDAFPEGVVASTHVRRPGPKDFRNYGSLRERETMAAMDSLGVRRPQLLFLGFPDEGLCFIASRRGLSRVHAFESIYTGRNEPPASEQVVRGVEYRDADLRRELELIITSFQPTMLAIPTPDDDHPDHGAGGIMTYESLNAVARPGKAPMVLEYLIHHAAWPDLDVDYDSPLVPPVDRTLLGGEWRSLALTDREIAGKRRALDLYPSQRLVIGSFLNSFARPNELFLVGRTNNKSECWCDATHVATETAPGRHRHAVHKP